MAVVGPKTLAVFHYDHSETKLLYQFIPPGTGAPLFSPNGSELAYIPRYNRSIRIVSLVDSKLPAVEIPGVVGQELQYPFTWSPDGSSLVYSTVHGLYIVNRDGSGLKPIPEAKDVPFMLNWSVNGTLSWSQGWLANLTPVFTQ